MRLLTKVVLTASWLVALAPSIPARPLDQLAQEFWEWRSVQQPQSGDDMTRIVRPPGWTPDWSPQAVAHYRQRLAAFQKRWEELDPSAWPVPQQVDYRLLGSALARVRWELDLTRNWQTNPLFYVEQTLGAVFEELLPPPPFDAPRSNNIVKRLAGIPATVEAAKVNLTDARRPFAQLAIAALEEVRPRLEKVARELKPHLHPRSAGQLDSATQEAIAALESFRGWLKERLDTLPEETAIGRAAYEFFLKEVALMPFSPDQLLLMGRQEWERAVAFEAYEKQRNHGLPELEFFPSQAEQMAREEQDELAIRQFIEEKGILSIPSWVQHYRNLPLPPYLAPLDFLGVTADHTSPARLDENGTSYIREPGPDLGYFALSTARDPRPLILHEGVPGHYFHLVLSWAHKNPIRRHYYDSGPMEGIGFYAEELLLQAGLFDSSPRTREIIYNFMRLRALRVEVDVKLALGKFSIAQAADYLHTTVPMDYETALQEAAFFASTPGQAISYQIGKLQIMGFLAEARRREGEAFNLRAFHDFVWGNANVPIALQETEYFATGDSTEP